MVKLTFYGGINEIGGNKILLEDGERRLLLDFGFPFKRYKLFYEEYLKPRSGAGLLDPLALGLLPPLEGLYRDDLVTPGLWPKFHSHPLYRKLGRVDGVLLSHAHLDHSGYISFLKEDIPVYATTVTAFLAKAMQDSGKAGFDQQVCYYSPTSYQCPSGWQQTACLSDDRTNKQRQFCLADARPEELSQPAVQFWQWGFWEKTARQKELVSCPLTSHSSCGFDLRCFPVDHSVPGACAWGIDTSAGWIIYSGDLRQHGKHARLTQGFVRQAAELKPRVLILEGTNVHRKTSVSEDEVYENALKAVAGARGLVIADFPARDIDRLLTFLEIARSTGRKLAVLPQDAYLLKTLRLLDRQIPDIAKDNNLAIYQDTTASKSPGLWRRHIFDDYQSKTVLADEVGSAQEQFILCFSFFDLNELPSIRPRPGSLYVYSSSEPHDEEQAIDFRRLHNWLEHFKFKGFGLPREKDGCWQIPEAEKGLHASGHASSPDLIRIAREIKPDVLMPVHSEYPGFYIDHLDSSAAVVLPAAGQAIELS